MVFLLDIIKAIIFFLPHFHCIRRQHGGDEARVPECGRGVWLGRKWNPQEVGRHTGNQRTELGDSRRRV
jgi:hypothetical protein